MRKCLQIVVSNEKHKHKIDIAKHSSLSGTNTVAPYIWMHVIKDLQTGVSDQELNKKNL